MISICLDYTLVSEVLAYSRHISFSQNVWSLLN